MQSSRVSSKLTSRDESMARQVGHLGSAHEGARDWRIQRLTALALTMLLTAGVSLFQARPMPSYKAMRIGSPTVAMDFSHAAR